MACLSKSSYMKKGSLNRTRFVYKRCISLTKMASGVQNWRFVYKYAVFNLQTSISPYKLASRITTQHLVFHPAGNFLIFLSSISFLHSYSNLYPQFKIPIPWSKSVSVWHVDPNISTHLFQKFLCIHKIH